MPNWIERKCTERGLRLTEQRRVIAKVLSESSDHPDAEELYVRASKIDANIVDTHDFGDGRARYETADDDHHDHLIDVTTGEVIEFVDEEIEELQEKIAAKLGYKLVDHRLELYGKKIK